MNDMRKELAREIITVFENYLDSLEVDKNALVKDVLTDYEFELLIRAYRSLNPFPEQAFIAGEEIDAGELVYIEDRKVYKFKPQP